MRGFGRAARDASTPQVSGAAASSMGTGCSRTLLAANNLKIEKTVPLIDLASQVRSVARSKTAIVVGLDFAGGLVLRVAPHSALGVGRRDAESAIAVDRRIIKIIALRAALARRAVSAFREQDPVSAGIS